MELTFEAKKQGQFSYDEFSRGMQSLRVDDIKNLGKKLVELDNNIDGSKGMFKDMYKFSFDYAKEPTHKSLPIDDAIDYRTGVAKWTPLEKLSPTKFSDSL